jgi:Domain of unknown function (DUF4388)
MGEQMGLVGRIEDVRLAEILQVVSGSRKTGTLVLKNESGASAVVVFDKGKVIQAATNDLRDSLGSLLFVKGLADERGLRSALEVQRGPKQGMRLGQVLIEMGILTPEKLEETIRKHIENLVCMLLKWEKGSFSFETGRPALDEEFEAVTRDLLIDDGLSTEYLLVESARLLDESNRIDPKPAARAADPSRPASLQPPENTAGDRRRPVVVVTEYRPSQATAPPPVAIIVGQQPSRMPLPGASPSAALLPLPPGKPRVDLSDSSEGEPLPGAGVAQRAREMDLLRATSERMRSQSTLTGVAVLALRYARNVVGRAAMFRVSGDEIVEIGQLGMKADGGSPNTRVRQVKLPASTGSVFAEVVQVGKSKTGRFPDGSWDRAFVMELGGTVPGEYFMVPAICEGKVAAVLYGDNAPGGAPLPAVTGLEVLMQHVGLTMEKMFLQERLRKLQKTDPLRP